MNDLNRMRGVSGSPLLYVILPVCTSRFANLRAIASCTKIVDVDLGSELWTDSSRNRLKYTVSARRLQVGGAYGADAELQRLGIATRLLSQFPGCCCCCCCCDYLLAGACEDRRPAACVVTVCHICTDGSLIDTTVCLIVSDCCVVRQPRAYFVVISCW